MVSAKPYLKIEILKYLSFAFAQLLGSKKKFKEFKGVKDNSLFIHLGSFQGKTYVFNSLNSFKLL